MEVNVEAGSEEPGVSFPELDGPTISGFWRRLLAFIIDCLILGAVGHIFGLFLFDFFAQLGGWGRLLGFCMALTYFVPRNSYIGKGQTIGKQFMKIEVVDSMGAHIRLGRSLLRYTLLAAPFFLNGAIISPSLMVPPIERIMGFVATFVVLGIGGGIIYLYLFNRRTRQSLHDLVVGTFVVRRAGQGSVQPGLIRRLHLVVVGSWFLALVCLVVFIPRLVQQDVVQALGAVQESILSSGEVRAVNAAEVKLGRLVGRDVGEIRRFQLDAIWKQPPSDYEAAAKRIAAIVLNEYPNVMQDDVLAITVSYGYDIGISRSWISHSAEHSPQEWQEILGLSRSEP